MKDNDDRTGFPGLGTDGRSDRIFFTVFFKIPLILVASIGFGIAGFVLGGYLNVTQGLPTIAEFRNRDPWAMATSHVNGEMYVGIAAQKDITPLNLSHIPKYVINAFLAPEDSRFFQHEPLDDSAIFPWLVRTALNKLWGESISRSGYSIREQVARTCFYRQISKNPKMFSRIRTTIVADRLDRAWSKKRILYVYLNRVYLRGQCYGVEAAAQHYFGKPTQNLSIAEAALIAGMVRRPRYYNPYRRKERARERRDLVLENMLLHGFINEEQFRNALKEKIELRKKSQGRVQRYTQISW